MDKFILLKGKFGLGNRLKAFTEGAIYSALTGRKLIVDWDDHRYSPDGKDVFSRLFNSELVSPISELPLDGTVSPAVWNGKLNRSFDDFVMADRSIRESAYRTSRLGRYYAEDVVVMFSSDLCVSRFGDLINRLPAGWPEPVEVALHQHVLRRHLKLQDRIQAQVDHFVSKHFAGPTIGVHVRYSDNLYKIPVKDRYGVSLYYPAVDAQLAKTPNAKIFLATDARKVQEKFLSRYRDRIISLPKAFPEGGIALHDPKTGEDRLQVIEAAILDAWILSKCQHLVADMQSTFAKTAWHVSAMSSADITHLHTHPR